MQALYGNNPTYTPVSSPGLTAATNNATTSLNALTGAAPNYEAQAMQTLKDFQTQAAPQEQADIKSIENAAGETGRVGAEGVTTSLGDLATQYANNLQAEEDQLASQTAQQQFSAEQAAEQAATQQQGQLFGQGETEAQRQNALQEQGITNLANEFGQQTQRGLSLAQLGFGYDPSSAQFKASGINSQNASDQAKAAGGLLSSFGSLAFG